MDTIDLTAPSTSTSYIDPQSGLMNRQKTQPPSSPTVQKKKEHFTLFEIVRVLILQGLVSPALWERTLTEIKLKVSNLMDTEVIALYFNLKLISNCISASALEAGDLSQEKMERVLEETQEYTTLFAYVERSIKHLSPLEYSKKSVKIILDLVSATFSKRNSSPYSPALDTRQSDFSLTDDDQMMGLFINKHRSSFKKELLIKQIFQIKTDDTMKQFSTPGEKGQFVVKIEISDFEDLKGVSPQNYWTKVWKKAVFLLNSENDEEYGMLNKILLTQGQKIANFGDVAMRQFVPTEDYTPNKKPRFGR